MENKDISQERMARPLEILLVEDNDDDYEITRIAFNRARLMTTIRRVRNGEEALKYIEKKPPFHGDGSCPKPDLILLDIRMPMMDGLQVLTILKQENFQYKSIPVLMLTSSRNEGDIEQSYRNGAAGYLQKPVTMDAFVNMVGHLTHYWQFVTLSL